MAAPGHSDIVAYEGADGAPVNDVDPACGAVTTTVIADNASDKIFNTPPFDTSDQTYYGGFHYGNISTGNLTNARAYNRCALKVNPIAGILTFGFVNGLDSGSKLFAASLVSGILQTEYVTCRAAAGFVSSVRSYDASAWMFVEFVNSSGLTAVPVGPITVSSTGVTMGVMRGSGSNNGKDLSVRQLYTFAQMAVRDTKGASLSYPDRRTDTSDTISAYGQGCRWEGLDEAIAIPGNELNTLETIALGCQLIIPANLPTPAYGKLQHGFSLVGNAVA